jgi:4-amino-4-deoxy-L-arabinose transferase-like glycosyltransferase
MQPDDTQPLEAAKRKPLPPGAKPDYSLAYLLLATAGFFLAWIPVLPIRRIDPDEFEHAHTAWCVFKGMLPYKDFFEHHTPWYPYTISPFFHWFSVDTSFESARHFLLFGRVFSLLLAMLSAFMVFLIGRTLDNRKLGLLAALFLAGQPVFFEKMVEMRPDVLAIPLFLGCLFFVLRGLSASDDSATKRKRWFFAAGLCLGGAIMSTQKMLFVLPGLFVGLGVWMLFAGPRRLSRTLAGIILFAGMAVPAALTWGFFALRGGGTDFVVNNFIINAGWKKMVNEQLLKVLETSWPVLLLCLLGSCVALYPFFREKQRQYGSFTLLSTMVGLIAGILVVPVAHRQYYLPILPLVCLFAAKGLCFLVELAKERSRGYLLVAATIPLFILPVLDIRTAFTQRNDQQLARLRYVFEHTKPTDPVMDGWEGTGVFRPHAFYYFFIHEESVPMLPQAKVDAYLDALENGTIRPRLIAMDENLVALGSRFVSFVKRNYVSSDDFLYFSKVGSP